MVNQMKLFRNAGQSQRFRFVVLVIGCFLVSMTFIVVSRPLTFPKENFQGKKNHTIDDPIEDDKTGIDEVMGMSTATDSGERGRWNYELIKPLLLPRSFTETTVEAEEERTDRDEDHNRMTLPTVSNYTIDDTLQVDKKTTPEQPGMSWTSDLIKAVEKMLSCDFSDPRVDICEMSGDIRIPGNSSDVIFVESPQRDQAFRFRPYARKGDQTAFGRVRELTVKSSTAAPQCTVSHNVPAVVFSTGGYTGNLFHDFTDVLIPLFLTARQYDGEVQFVVSDMNPWWVYKYRLLFQKLSKYPPIDFDKDKGVHCFTKVVVGLRANKELSIDPARAPNGYSMVDFGKFMRSALSLERESMSNIEDLAGRRPRILIVARKRSRKFVNLFEIAQLAEQLGFEVEVNEAEVGSDVAQFAKLVNSVDVMVGVHGAGLTNLVFLPPNATVIQVVPWGGLEWLSMLDFGDPAKDMKLNYVQYSIDIEESSLTEQYPRDHPVFKDPFSFHKQGFHVLRSTFMANQNVKLDINKFKSVLWKALEHIIQ
ncbi:unnamed protein product [Musa acuminata subsp. malaccensis]|uniref:(wild Malaysian banana) hypothetical protein n=1 Tax=Musa acuminata subsp. malaccensis TaxID=214687 RepID=A0A8D7B676_MUSAM|nr:unnamed protein product [Musa acuminata subsp. malaccensis]